ncbi:hypothetical protein [Methanolacinia paynteri]|uniref:hypothetical protein n=1 Tax=Methanolacinia paynteri TaxID=230356 RepID=UPI00064E1629|nr:hypothetical protein [Methanolacinia paynteri]
MVKRKENFLALTAALGLICAIMAAGCTAGIDQKGDGQVQGADQAPGKSTETIQSQIPKVSVSWKDFYPDYDDRTKSEIIEKAKDEIMQVFPDIDRSSLSGNWVESERYNDAGTKQIGSPYIEFEDVTYASGESRNYKIRVDPTRMKITYYSPNTAYNGQPVIPYNEAKQKAIEFIRKAQGGDSIVDDPDAISYFKNAYSEGELPMAYVVYYKTYNGVVYQENSVSVDYDMRKDKVERYFDDLTDPELLSGLTILSPEPDITYEEAIQVLEETLSKKYNLEEEGLEYITLSNCDSYLSWWDNDNLVYADDPKPLPLVWDIGMTSTESRKEYEEERVDPTSGSFRIDAHTGEVTRLVYDGDIFVKTYGYMGSSNPQ